MYMIIGLTILNLINPFYWVGFMFFSPKKYINILYYLVYNIIIQLICYPFYEQLLKTEKTKHVSLHIAIIIITVLTFIAVTTKKVQAK